MASKLKQKYDSGELKAYVEDSMLDLMDFTDGVVKYCSVVIESDCGCDEVHVTFVGIRKGEENES